jgi:hypothetical protein
MSTHERRSGVDRRATKRYAIEMEVEWEGSSGRAPGSISDVSLDGCFVLCSGDVGDGDHVKIFVTLEDGMKVEFSGRVVNHVFEIGFGVKFDQLTKQQRELLLNILRDSEST